MKTINASFKVKCLAILDQVKRTGEPVTILKRGKPVAQLVPPAPSNKNYPLYSLIGTVELAVPLRENYEAITPGYHLNKRHWNTLRLDGSLPDEEVRELIDLCYRLVVGGLKGQSAKR